MCAGKFLLVEGKCPLKEGGGKGSIGLLAYIQMQLWSLSTAVCCLYLKYIVFRDYLYLQKPLDLLYPAI